VTVHFVRGNYRWEYLGDSADAPPWYRYTERPEDPTAMSTEDLRRLKQTWYQEATDNDELTYLGDLAEELGWNTDTPEGSESVWQGADDEVGRVQVVVERDAPDADPRLRVLVDGEEVCNSAKGLFVPGAWLDVTRGALGELERTRELRQQRMEAEEHEELRHALWLDRTEPGQREPRTPVRALAMALAR
jgi:hypothetical protein